MMHQNPLHDAEQVPEDRVQMNPPSGREPLLRRYRWKDLTEAEKEAVQDCLGIAATRGGVGLGATLTVAALLSSIRRGRPPLPPALRYGSLTIFSFSGAYAGFMSAGNIYSQRILAVPNSRLADDLRTVIGDWHSRGPAPELEAIPHEPLPEGAPGTGRGKDEITPRDPKEVRAEQRRKQKQESQDTRWTDKIGLTK